MSRNKEPLFIGGFRVPDELADKPLMAPEKPRELGLCWAGSETAFYRYLEDAAMACGEREFGYLEIGVAEGRTFARVCEWLHDYAETVKPYRDFRWRAIGFDIVGSDWLNIEALDIVRATYPSAHYLILDPPNGIHLESVLSTTPRDIDFAMIDGCHCLPCVMSDFITVSAVMRPGGVVAFHDTEYGVQGVEPQHNGRNIEVRDALMKLGLLRYIEPLSTELNGSSFSGKVSDPLRGWALLEETKGDRDRNGIGACFFQFRP